MALMMAAALGSSGDSGREGVNAALVFCRVDMAAVDGS